MIIKNKKTAMYLLIISLFVSIAGDFVVSSISDKLTWQIRDTQRIITEEQERARVESPPSSVNIVEFPDGHKEVTVTAFASIGFEAGLAGEIIKFYSARLIDLVTLKNLFDLLEFFFKTTFEIEAMFILGMCMAWALKRRTFWQTALLASWKWSGAPRLRFV